MKKLLLFLAIIFSTHSHALEFQGKFLQGYFILGKAKAFALPKIKYPCKNLP